MATLEPGERPLRKLPRALRIRVLAHALERAKARLAKSMAHCRDQGRTPRPSDLRRWHEIGQEIEEFARTLAALRAGEAPPPSPKTGARMALLPDRIGQPDRGELDRLERLAGRES